MERSISKCSDMSLNYLTSLGLQSFAQFAGTTGGKPALVFEVRNNYSSVFPTYSHCIGFIFRATSLTKVLTFSLLWLLLSELVFGLTYHIPPFLPIHFADLL